MSDSNNVKIGNVKVTVLEDGYLNLPKEVLKNKIKLIFIQYTYLLIFKILTISSKPSVKAAGPGCKINGDFIS